MLLASQNLSPEQDCEQLDTAWQVFMPPSMFSLHTGVVANDEQSEDDVQNTDNYHLNDNTIHVVVYLLSIYRCWKHHNTDPLNIENDMLILIDKF